MSLDSIEHRSNEPMSDHTSFQIGGKVREMFFAKNEDELIYLCKTLTSEILIIGNGTNLLVDDADLDISVIKTSGIDHIALTGETEITAGCGILLSKLSVFACDNGLSGLEFAHGIPGTLGGAVLMNAGAYGGEMKDVIQSTRAYSRDAGIYDVTEHEFGYRHSRFERSGDVILSSVIRLTKDDPDNIKGRMFELARRRRESQPLNVPSAGSTFKRPKDGYAAAMIEQAKLKGFSIGGAQVSQKHSGFIVNCGGATFKDAMAVIDHVRQTIFEKFGVELETEVKIIGNSHHLGTVGCR